MTSRNFEDAALNIYWLLTWVARRAGKKTVANPLARNNPMHDGGDDQNDSCSLSPVAFVVHYTHLSPFTSITMMTCPHHDRKLKCFGEFVGLNRRKWEKSAVVHMATVLGISSGVLEVDPVDFLLYLMPLIGSQRSEPTKKIKAAFEELLSREQNLSIDEKELSKLEVELPIEEEEVEGEEEEEEEVEEDEEDEEEEEEDEEEESMVTYRTFRKHLLLLHDVYDIFSNDSSTPTLTDSVDPLWKYTLKTLTKRKVKSNRTRKTSLKSCFAWVTAESEKRSKSKPPPTGAGPRTKTRRRKQAEAPSGAPPAKKPARRVGGHQQAVVTESNGAVDSMPPKGGARSGGRRRTQTTTTASRGTVDAMPSRGAQRGACRHRSAESSGVADASPNPDESPSPAAGEAAAEAEEPAIVWTPSPHGGSIPNGRPRRDSAAADEAVDGDQAPANDRTTSPDAQPHLAAAESDGEVGEDDVQAESDGVYESSISFEWEYGAAASDGKVEEDDDALANDPDRASVMSDDGIEPANSREADRTTVNSNESPSRNADKPNEADEDIMSATYRTPTSRYGSPLCDDGTLNETVVDEDTAATYGTPTSSPDGVAASTNVAEMTGSQQQQLPLHPHHQGTQGGMPGRVRFDERHNTIHFFDPPQSGLHTGLFESPDEDGTPSDAPPQSSAPDSSSAHTSSSARPNHAHFSEGAAERVNEPIEPLRSSQSSRPADDDAMVPFDTRVLRAKYKYEDGEVTRAWNDKNERIKQLSAFPL